MVTVYSKNNCVQCKMTKRFLDSNNVEYKEINLDEQPEYIDQVKELGCCSYYSDTDRSFLWFPAR